MQNKCRCATWVIVKYMRSVYLHFKKGWGSLVLFCFPNSSNTAGSTNNNLKPNLLWKRSCASAIELWLSPWWLGEQVEDPQQAPALLRQKRKHQILQKNHVPCRWWLKSRDSQHFVRKGFEIRPGAQLKRALWEMLQKLAKNTSNTNDVMNKWVGDWHMCCYWIGLVQLQKPATTATYKLLWM